MANIALLLPGNLSKYFLEKITLNISKSFPLLFTDKAGELLSHLAREGEVEDALKLTRSLLAVEIDDNNPDSFSFLKTRPIVGSWEFAEILKKNVPDLILAAKLPALEHFVDMLLTIVKADRHDKTEQFYDGSEIWCPKLDHAEYVAHRDLRECIVACLRDSIARLIKTKNVSVSNIVSALESRRYLVFQRLALFVIAHSNQENMVLVEQRLLDNRLANNFYLDQEYATLARLCFGELDKKTQRAWLDMILAGPVANDVFDGIGHSKPEWWTPERIEDWKKNKLSCVIDLLPASWKNEHQALVSGLEVRTDFRHFSGVSFSRGPESPLSANELENLSTRDLIDFLKNWIPSGDMLAANPSGLGKDIQRVVAAAPQRFTAELPKFQNVDPTYVRYVIVGFRKAVRSGQKFDWVPVLDFCQWAINQPDKIREIKNGYEMEQDSGFLNTKKEVCNLIESGVTANINVIPSELNEYVWEILIPLTEHPEPTQEEEVDFAGGGEFALTLAINFIRPSAIRCLTRMVSILHRKNEPEIDINKQVHKLTALLDKHLDHTSEPARSVRAIYGENLPALALLDENWVSNNIERIFPKEIEHKELRHAALDTLLKWGGYHDHIFPQLRLVVAEEIPFLETREFLGASHETPDQKISHFLSISYRRKLIDLDSSDLLGAFWKHSSDELKAEFISCQGYYLNHEKSVPSADEIERLIQYWEKRKENTQHEMLEQEAAQLGFGSLTTCFPEMWRLNQLIYALGICKKPMLENLVVEKLVELTPKWPGLSVRALRLILEGLHSNNVSYFRGSIRMTVEAARVSGDELAEKEATKLVGFLISNGYFEFEDLSETRPSI